MLQLDLALSDYGPGATDARIQLRDGVGKDDRRNLGRRHQQQQFRRQQFCLRGPQFARQRAALGKLQPTTDAETQALAAAKAAVDAIGQSRLQMSFALTTPISYPLMDTVVGWAMLLFCGFGLMSKGNPMSIVVAIVGAVAVASAFHLIIDLSSPYSGIFSRFSGAARTGPRVMGKE